MSENAVEQDFQGQPAGTEGTAEPEGHTTPWAQYLEPLPESVRPLVEPTFKQWDADVTKRFQTYSQQIDAYKPWESVVQSGFDPETTQQAIALAQALQADPQEVLNNLAQALGVNLDQGTAESDTTEDFDDGEYVDPRLATVEQMTNQMAEILLAQEEQARTAQEDAEFEQYLGSLKEKYGDYDEDYVLAHIQLGMSGEQAVEKYHQTVQQIQQRVATSQSAAPTVLGSGGGLPSQVIDPAQLSAKDTKSLVAQYLAQANQQ